MIAALAQPSLRRAALALPCLLGGALLVAATVSCGPPKPTVQPTLKADTLVVCFYPNFQPFVGKDAQGVWSGWDVDYLKKFAEQQKLKHFEVYESPEFAGIWKLAGENKCDIAASGISDLPSRREDTGTLGTWSATYYTVLRAFAVLKGTPLTGLAELEGKTVIVTAGSTADLDITHRMACTQPPPSINVLRTNDEAAGAAAVTKGEAFAYGGGLGSIQDLAKPPEANLEAAWPHCLMDQDCKPTNEPFSFVVRTASTGLADALNAYINAGQGGAWDYQGNVDKREHGGDPVTCP